MALSDADFYAFSRATGTPVVEDPEAKARIAPQVAEWRRNQLKSPETKQAESSNLLQNLGLGAAVAGLGALGVAALGRRGGVRMGNVGRAAAQGVQEVNFEDLGNVYRAAGRTQPPPSRPAPSRPAPTPAAAPTPPPRPATSRRGGVQLADLNQIPGTEPRGLLRGREPGGEITRTPRQVGIVPAEITEVAVSDITPTAATRQLPGTKDFIAGYFQKTGTPAGYLTEAVDEIAPIADRADELLMERELNRQRDIARKIRAQEATIQGAGERVLAEIQAEAAQAPQQIVAVEQVKPESLVTKQQNAQAFLNDQISNAINVAEDQMTGRVKAQLQRNEDLDMSQVDLLEEMAEQSRIQGMEQDEPINQVAASLTDGLPVDQAEGEGRINQLVEQGKRYLRAQEVDLDYDYSAENAIQTQQVNQRIRRALALRNQANQILDEIKLEGQQVSPQVSPQEFASEFNKQYREELNDELALVDNARQRAELRGEETREIGEDIESLLTGGIAPIETTMRGRQLRGGKPGITGDIAYLDEAGRFASADTGLKTRQEQGPQFEEKARTLNRLRSASDEELTYILQKNQQALANNQPRTRLEADTARLASEVLRSRAVNNPEPTQLQLNALERAQASVDLSRQILNQARNQRPTLAPGPAQDVARSMETLRRGMIVEPSEPLPEYPSVQQLRTGYVSEEKGDIGPILGAPDVYTGAAAEAAGPVIFTGKSKANTVIRGPRITGAVETATGRRYLTQDNPDVIGTVYNVAGTPRNRAIAAQVEQNAQNFLADALAGGLQQKAISTPETYVTPGREPGPLLPPQQGPRISPLSLAGSLGLPGQEPSKRTGYTQYRPGRSVAAPISPFIGDMPGGTVIATLQTPSRPVPAGRDIGARPGTMDLTRRGEKARYYSQVPQTQFITGMEPASIGPLTQSPGLARIGGYYEDPIIGAGRKQIIQPTSIGQRIAYPHMTPLRQAPDYSGNIATNIPRYGIGGEDWQNDLMRSAFRRGGPMRTYRAEP